ncbi:flagellar motor switch protein FliN [Leptospira licerasiae]|uniref:Flagellar motor switch protein FliN n=1 Tax=Leptospira licerasiae str. MMD4847 TaxID=1049971 RepID=A0ABP2REG6_9LEPT|nr:flagellar motor switch protein FliN [Leptospira licerasiae]EIE01622.1 flagellar motor switch protein FliN [Leptospira licerasiae serovar Varillal str. VAR 010]EJZ42840.1 flagellar motor switch protein FliN [Leptospira licerasiae str. MMD4847]TGM86529.1 flagellar motor switch protein FliN [Leptospira licerasiae]
MGEGSLSQDDIDALLTGSSPGGGGGGSADFNLSGELDSLLGDAGGGAGASTSPASGGAPSFADIAAALGPSSTPAPPKASARSSSVSSNTANLNLLLDVNVALTVELGRTNMYIKDVLGLNEGAVVELDNAVGEDLDILANGKLVGKGKLVLLDDYYGIRITEIVDPSRRMI